MICVINQLEILDGKGFWSSFQVKRPVLSRFAKEWLIILELSPKWTLFRHFQAKGMTGDGVMLLSHLSFNSLVLNLGREDASLLK